MSPRTAFVLSLLTALATSQSSLSATPTIPAGITRVSQLFSVLATASTTPDLGNPANIANYPLCAQICTNDTIVIGKQVGTPYGDGDSLEVLCSPRFRAANAGCQAATCTPDEYTTTQILAQQLCGSLYNANATLSSSVSSAVASATSAAKAATEGKDPTDLANFPPCGVSRLASSSVHLPTHPHDRMYEVVRKADLCPLPQQKCIPQNNYNGCGSNTNLECICQGIQFNQAINTCELSTCSPADLQTISFLAEKLCEPVGGILTFPVNYTGPTPSNTTNTTLSSPSPVPFTGEAGKVRKGWVGYSVAVVAIGLGVLML
ncbi:MAG: hypothetical protein Q9195_006597 [Heterodermia aff. obscurata]